MNIEDRIKQEIDDEADAVDAALGMALVLILVLFCAFSFGLVYQLAAPWIAEVLTTIWNYLR